MKYHFLDEGKGNPILMIHGNPTWSFYFREVVKKLSSNFRIIAPDHIGCGLSDKPDATQYDYNLKSRVDDIEALVDYLGLNKDIVLALHDWGGMIGATYALRYPKRISKIILMNTAAFFPPQNKPLPTRLKIIRNIKTIAVPAVLGFNLFARSALFMATCKKLSKSVKAGLIAPYNCWKNRIATLKFVQDIPVHKTDPSYKLVKYVDQNLYRLSKIPMLICWGKHDFVFDKSYLSEWRLRFPNAKIHVFSDAGHYVLEDKPDEIIFLIKEYLQ